MCSTESLPLAAVAAAGQALHSRRRGPVPGDFALLGAQVVELVECGPALVWVRFPDGDPDSAVAVQRTALDFPDTLRAD